MKTIGNILWLFICGFWLALEWAAAGLLCCITIVGIPFGIQCFKMARLSLWPFGRVVVPSIKIPVLGTIGNILWFIPGLIIALSYAVAGVLLCITIVGIPFGIQAFKFIPLAISPFGKDVVKANSIQALPSGALAIPA